MTEFLKCLAGGVLGYLLSMLFFSWQSDSQAFRHRFMFQSYYSKGIFCGKKRSTVAKTMLIMGTSVFAFLTLFAVFSGIEPVAYGNRIASIGMGAFVHAMVLEDSVNRKD